MSIVIDIDPVLLQLGPVALRWYSLTFGAGLAVAAWIILREAKRLGLDPGKVGNVVLWGIVGGLVGARLLHVIDKLDYYAAHPHQILMVSQGGLAIWGGLAVGGAAALIGARREGLRIPVLADAAAIGLLPGQMIGRLGCIINGDAYGGPTGLPWGFTYTNAGAMIPDRLKGIPTHPYPVYEILWNLGLLVILLGLRKRASLPAGFLFVVYLGGYAAGRMVLSTVRQEAIAFWGLQQAQVVAGAAVVAAVAVGTYLVWTRTRQGPEARPAGAGGDGA